MMLKRAWSAEIHRKAEAGELEDDTDKVREMLEQEIANLPRRGG